MKSFSLLVAAGLATLGTAAPATAEAPPSVTLNGPAALSVHTLPKTGEARPRELVIRAEVPGRTALTGTYTIRVDLAGIAGVATADAGPGGECATEGDSLLCTRTRLEPGDRPAVRLDLRPAPGSRAGDTGRIAVSGTGDARFTGFTTRVTVGGGDMAAEPFRMAARTRVGQEQPVPVAFTNHGPEDIAELTLTLRYSRGVAFLQRYDNCDYPGPGARARETVVCHVPGPFEAGESYGLPEGALTLRTTERALADEFSYRLDAVPERTGAPQRARTAAGKLLRPVARKAVPAAARATDPTPRDNGQSFRFTTPNTADFAAVGTTVGALPGETVPVTVGLRNAGPAWVEDPDGRAFGATEFVLPAGTTAVAVPAACAPHDAQGRPLEERLGAPVYHCAAGRSYHLDGQRTEHTFRLRVDRPGAGPGSVAVGRSFEAGRLLPFTGPAGNDRATVLVTARTAPTATPSGTATAGPVPSATPTPAPTASSGTTATASASPSPTATRRSGDLASTGSEAGTLAGIALAAVLAGGALVAVFRRRGTGRA
ncbi:hypothetical protein [Streptomyces sp. NPDC097619]|uniref:hypothetical protein n=1 Tax=Streptomyces sp. NPDC097619 TaxID=3157228 RepID=UPI0033269043